MDVAARTTLVRRLALEAGFHRVGVARAHARDLDRQRLSDWLAAGHHGDMDWLARNIDRRCDPDQVVPGARSVIMLAVDYDSDAPHSMESGAVPKGHGWISRYAWGTDYHDVLTKRLRTLANAINDHIAPTLAPDFRGPGQAEGAFESRRDFRYYVDHGPVLERAWGQEAGMGWQGRHSLLVDPERGSYFFLAAVLTTLELTPDRPQTDHCGSCTACVDACPTDAILPGRTVDARRCISTLTIETRGELSAAQRPLLGHHVFGCDICQEVCPFTRFSQPSGEGDFAPRPGNVAPDLADLLALDEAAFRERFRKSPLKRRKLAGLQDNARAVVDNEA